MQSPGAAGSLLSGSGPQPRAPCRASVRRGQPRPSVHAPSAGYSLHIWPCGQTRSPRPPHSRRGLPAATAGGGDGGEYGGGAHPSRSAVSPAHPELCLHTCPRDRLGLHTSLSTRDFCPFPPPAPGLSPRPCLCLPCPQPVVWSVTQGSPSLAPCLLLPPLCFVSTPVSKSQSPHFRLQSSHSLCLSLPSTRPHTHAPSLLGWR